MKKYYLAVLSVLFFIPAAAESVTVVITPAPGAAAAEQTIIAEVADTEASRRRGLSGRMTLAADAGMLFIFSPPRDVCLWMKDTHIPLAAAFANVDGQIRRVTQMEAETTRRHCAGEKVQYALETVPAVFADGEAFIGGRLRIVAGEQ